jgi:hypothetical protein
VNVERGIVRFTVNVLLVLLDFFSADLGVFGLSKASGGFKVSDCGVSALGLLGTSDRGVSDLGLL